MLFLSVLNVVSTEPNRPNVMWFSFRYRNQSRCSPQWPCLLLAAYRSGSSSSGGPATPGRDAASLLDNDAASLLDIEDAASLLGIEGREANDGADDDAFDDGGAAATDDAFAFDGGAAATWL